MTRIHSRIHSKLATCWIAVAALGLLAAPAHAGQLGESWITAKVRARLIRHPGIAPFAINVDTQDGVVTLFGNINAEVDKREAGRQAMMVSGVQHLQNELPVVPQQAENLLEKGMSHRSYRNSALDGTQRDATLEEALVGQYQAPG